MKHKTVADALSSSGVKNVAPFSNISMPFTLKPHQVQGLNLSLRKDRSGLFFDPRTGKTIVFTLAAIYCAHYGVKSIILMPPILFSQFHESWKELKGNPFSLYIFNQSKKRREALLKKWGEEGFPDCLTMTKELFKKHWRELSEAGYRQLVFDESHLGLGKVSTGTYFSVSGFIQAPGGRLILSTGTPIPTGIEGVYPSIKLINPGAYRDEDDFYRKHVEMTKITQKNRRGKEVLIDVPCGYKNLPLLHSNLYKNAVRARRFEVLSIDKPNIQTVPVELSSPHYTLYRRLMKERVLEVGDEVIPAVQASKLRMLALRLISSPQNYSDKPIANQTLTALEQLLHSAGIDAGEKIAVFANFNESVVTVTEKLKKYGARSVYGKNTASENARSVKAFQEDPECRVLVLNPQAGGVGLKLGHICTTVIFYEPVGSPGIFDQALSRVILEGQKKAVVCYILRVLDTISPKAIGNMLNKNHDIKQVNMDIQTLLDELVLT